MRNLSQEERATLYPLIHKMSMLDAEVEKAKARRDVAIANLKMTIAELREKCDVLPIHGLDEETGEWTKKNDDGTSTPLIGA